MSQDSSFLRRKHLICTQTALPVHSLMLIFILDLHHVSFIAGLILFPLLRMHSPLLLLVWIYIARYPWSYAVAFNRTAPGPLFSHIVGFEHFSIYCLHHSCVRSHCERIYSTQGVRTDVPAPMVSPPRLRTTRPMSLFIENVSMGITDGFATNECEFERRVISTTAAVFFDMNRGLVLRTAPVALSHVYSSLLNIAGISRDWWKSST